MRHNLAVWIESSGVGVLDKAVAVLDAVSGGARTLTELVVATQLNRATAHRLAGALVVTGLLRRDAEARYLPGLRLIALGRAASQALPLSAAAQPVLEQLRDETGESAQLYVRQGEVRVCVAAAESPHGLRTIVPLGARTGPLPGVGGGGAARRGVALGGECGGARSRRRFGQRTGLRLVTG